MGCSLAASFAVLIKEFRRNDNPDFLFIEPAGMVTTQELVAASKLAQRDCNYEIGPVITLVNAEDFEFLWEERRNLLVAQMEDADLVALSRADLQEKTVLGRIKTEIEPFSKEIIELSTAKGQGLERVMNLLDSP
ncbi:MAG: hypothetical protein HY912_16895 [Desulfomonile tiedjei]|uniref:CobW/HypB/UreG nucleotide-binding domain-containing protein n=1 Tax=Desulfomonile tiedjei TaxID=2358 RepID=A0A9D6V3G3_9BACT|nr:hypothetical protein [Desulfomonile tiedjei]